MVTPDTNIDLSVHDELYVPEEHGQPEAAVTPYSLSPEIKPLTHGHDEGDEVIAVVPWGLF